MRYGKDLFQWTYVGFDPKDPLILIGLKDPLDNRNRLLVKAQNDREIQTDVAELLNLELPGSGHGAYEVLKTRENVKVLLMVEQDAPRFFYLNITLDTTRGLVFSVLQA